MIWSHSWKSKMSLLVLQVVCFSNIPPGGLPKPWNLCSKTHQKSNFWCRISHHHMIYPYHITIWYLHMISTYPKKAIYDIGTKIFFWPSMSCTPIKNWEIENVNTWFWKLATGIRSEKSQDVISSHFRFPKMPFWVLQVALFWKIEPGGPTKPWNLCSKTH